MADRRDDLLLEVVVDTVSNNAYVYTSDWLSTDDVDSVRLRYILDGDVTSLTAHLQESIDEINVIASVPVASDLASLASECTLTARYFRVVVESTSSNTSHGATEFQLAVRAVRK
jgi:hypothetical protein